MSGRAGYLQTCWRQRLETRLSSLYACLVSPKLHVAQSPLFQVSFKSSMGFKATTYKTEGFGLTRRANTYTCTDAYNNSDEAHLKMIVLGVLVEGPKRPHKHKDPTNHAFWYPPDAGSWNQNVRSLCFCDLWAPVVALRWQRRLPYITASQGRDWAPVLGTGPK